MLEARGEPGDFDSTYNYLQVMLTLTVFRNLKKTGRANLKLSFVVRAGTGPNEDGSSPMISKSMKCGLLPKIHSSPRCSDVVASRPSLSVYRIFL